MLALESIIDSNRAFNTEILINRNEALGAFSLELRLWFSSICFDLDIVCILPKFVIDTFLFLKKIFQFFR